MKIIKSNKYFRVVVHKRNDGFFIIHESAFIDARKFIATHSMFLSNKEFDELIKIKNELCRD